MTVFCGCDPGLTGALAFLDTNTAKMSIYDMPTVEITNSGGAKRKHLVPERLARIVDYHDPEKSLIENVHSTPNDGHVGAFIFGKATGIVWGVFAGLDVPLEQVTPGKWKKDLRVPADKEEAMIVAGRLLPQCRSLWSRKKDHGRAEAALIALYLAILNGFSPSQPITPGKTI
ncbi:crossover junction endodeoxyribonuclease [Citromicrobium phage vB_CbaS-RXM]|nr:crossover junction endodeoxyribonuclease [Citromicrobium phage vB_CbaS-RXM]